MLRLFFILLTLSITARAAPDTAFLSKHCTECHDAEVKKGGLDLTALAMKPEDRKNFDAWVKVYDRVTKGEMPPAKKERPEVKAQQAFLASVKQPLVDYQSHEQQTKGRTVLRRLNRVEYEHTVHDLLAIETPLKHILPEDARVHGFDTVSEGLGLSQLHIEKYLEAADVALDAALVLTEKPERTVQHFNYKEHEGVRKHLDTPEGAQTDKNNPKSKHHLLFRELPDVVVFFTTPDYIMGLKNMRVPVSGYYRIRISGRAYQSQGKAVSTLIYANDFKTKRLLSFFDLPPDQQRIYECTVFLNRGEHLNIESDEINYDAKGQNVYNVGGRTFEGVGIALQWTEVEGPLIDDWPLASVKRAAGDVPLKAFEHNKQPYRNGAKVAYEFAPADAKASLQSAIATFATRAFRRSLEADESAAFATLATDAVAAGASFEDALRVGLRAVLTAPQFLLFEEQPGTLNDVALATRLSYFLWNSAPDDELLAAAASHQLTKPAVLTAQTERLLKSPKSIAFVKDFVGQWLELRNINATTPDMRLYPEFDLLLRESMVGETEAFFTEMLTKNLSVKNFIHSDFAMLNRRLAEHYGLEGANSEAFQHVSLPADSPRGGLLTQASVLKVTANGTVTSPVLRGAWVMRHLLGQPPPPPPANVGAIEPDTRGATTIREQLAKHRTSETCASCHRNIDPPGFALENFDVIGGWRDSYRSQDKGTNAKRKFHGQNVWQYKEGLPVDASGEFADGRAFKDIIEFKRLLLSQDDAVLRCVAENLLTYATGAGIEFADRDAVTTLTQQVRKDGSGLRTLVHAIVQSPLFRNK
jgi:hypothetical protein